MTSIRCPACDSFFDSQSNAGHCPDCGADLSAETFDETKDELPEQSINRTRTANSDTDSFRLSQSDHEERYVGPYRLTKLLGSGSFGSVWKAFDERLDRHVAIKIPHDRDASGDRLHRFLDEARAIAALDHPGLLRVFEVGQSTEFPYIVTEFIDGCDLKAYLEDQEISIRIASSLCIKMAIALEHAHSAGIVHRDLKPANVMMDQHGEPHIMDFGLAKQFTQRDTEKTVDGQLMGTPAYMSPEQAKGLSRHVDRRSDVFSLGIMLYEMLTGERPFRGKSAMLLRQVIEDEATPPRRLNSAVPVDLQSICLKCLEKEPDRRYESASAFAADLEAFLADRPVSAKPATRLQKFNKWCRRNPVVAAISSLAISFLVALLILSTAFLIRERRLRVSINDALREKSQALQDTQRVTVDLNKNQTGLQSAMDLIKTNQRLAKKQLVLYAESLYAYQISACQRGLRDGDWIQARQQLEAIAKADPDDQRRCWTWDFLNHQLNQRCKWFSGRKARIDHLIITDDEAQGIISRNLWGHMERWQKNDGDFDPIATAIPRYDGTNDFDYSTRHQCFAIVDLDGHLSIIGPSGGKDPLGEAAEELVLSSVRFQPGTDRLIAFDQTGNASIIGINPNDLEQTSQRTWVVQARWSGKGAVDDVRWSPSGDMVAILRGGKIDLRSMPDGGQINTIQLRQGINCLAWSTEDELLAGSGWSVSSIAIPDGKATPFAGRTYGARAIVRVPNSNQFCILSRNGNLQNWSVSQRRMTFEIKLFDTEGTTLVCSKDGRYLFAGSTEGEIARVDLSAKEPFAASKFEVGSTVRRIDWDRETSNLAAADWSGRYTVWNTETGTQSQSNTISENGRFCESASWHPFGDRIATSRNDGTIQLWDAVTGAHVATTTGHNGSAYGIAWKPDGSQLASGGTDGMVRIWDGRSLQEIEVWGVGDAIEQVAWGPHGKTLFAAGVRLVVRDVKSREILLNERAGGRRYFNVAVHPDGSQFATCGSNGLIQIRSLEAIDDDAITLRASDGELRGLAWSADGRCLVSTDWRGEVAVWNVTAKRRLLTVLSPPPGSESRAWSAAFEPDGNRLAVSNARGEILVWESR